MGAKSLSRWQLGDMGAGIGVVRAAILGRVGRRAAVDGLGNVGLFRDPRRGGEIFGEIAPSGALFRAGFFWAASAWRPSSDWDASRRRSSGPDHWRCPASNENNGGFLWNPRAKIFATRLPWKTYVYRW